MKHPYTIYILCILASLLFSCEKDLEFNGKETKSLLVLNSFVCAGEPISVNLSKSRFFLDNNEDFEYINDADIKLWKEDEIVSSFTFISNDGDYLNNYIPKEGETLRITASSPGLDPVEATVQLSSPPTILKVDTINHSKLYYWTFEEEYYPDYVEGDLSFDMTVHIKDPRGVANYYRIFPYLIVTYKDGNVFTSEILDIDSNDPVLSNTNNSFFDSEENEGYFNFSDELFDGKEYPLKLSWRLWMSSTIYHYEEIISLEAVVELQELSKEYYLYEISREAASRAEEGGGLFSEPVQIFSNINGGIGIFASYAKTTYNISIELPEKSDANPPIYY